MPINDLPMYPTPQQAAYRMDQPKKNSPKIRNTSSSSGQHHHQSQPQQQQQQYNGSANANGNVVYRPAAPKANPSYGYQPQQAPPPPQPQYQVQPQYSPQPPPPQQQYYQPQPQYQVQQPQYQVQQPPQPQPQPPPTQYPRQPNPQYYVPPAPQQVAPPPQQFTQPPPPPTHPEQQQRYHSQEYSQPPPQQQQKQQHSGAAPSSSRKPPPDTRQQQQSQYAKNNRSKESLGEPSSSKISKDELRALFERTDTNRSGRISARELTALLSNLDNTKFNDHTVVLLIKLFNQKGSASSSPTTNSSTSQHHININSASLTFEQFCSLWKYIHDYRKLFKQADVDNSGDITFGEFQEILLKIGYKLNIDLILNIFTRFSYKEINQFDYNNSSNLIGKLKFDSFIELLAYLSTLTDIFKKYDKGMVGVANIKYSDFLQEIINIP
ncbi:hypothetical protein DFJ63DRAFT_335088 [Scheffersomyces coipomensis]|uniref:uncharacterized protein n=1 Tax=Scheffersomyces coipomensis TaxID=1788519 RepID=UPI00315C6323